MISIAEALSEAVPAVLNMEVFLTSLNYNPLNRYTSKLWELNCDRNRL
jgi:hypothetical protein